MALDLGFVPYAEYSGSLDLYYDIGVSLPKDLFTTLSYQEFCVRFLLTDPTASGIFQYDLDFYFRKREWNSTTSDWDEYYKDICKEKGTLTYQDGVIELPVLAANRRANPGFFTLDKSNKDYIFIRDMVSTPTLSSLSQGADIPSGKLTYYWPDGRRFLLFFQCSPAYDLEEFQVNGDVSDEQLTFSWSVGGQSHYAFEVADAQGNIVYTKSEATARQSVTLPAATLGTGQYTARVQAGYTLESLFGGLAKSGLQSEVAELPITVHRITPEIIAFEPDGVPQRWDEPLLFYWTSENQQRFELVLRQNGQVVKTYTGETATAVDMPAGTIGAGATSATLTLTYVPTWGTEEDKVQTSKTIEFEAYGVPPVPVITTPATVETAYPVVTWTASEQYTYRLRIWQDGVLVQDTGEVQSSAQSCALTEPLALGAYTVTLIVKSEYGLYSPEASRDMLVAFKVPPIPTVDARAAPAQYAIAVTVTNPASDLFSHADLLRRPADGSAGWTRIASGLPREAVYMDYTTASDVQYVYIVRAIGTSGGYSESDPAAASVSVRWTQLFDPAHPDEPVILRLEPSKSQTDKRGIYSMLCAGASRPRFEFSGDRYAVIDASFFCRTADYDRLRTLFYDAPILCFRDDRGRRLFGCISRELEAEDDLPGWCKVKLQFTEGDYTEGV